MGNVGASALPLLTNTVTLVAGWKYGFGAMVPLVAGVTACLWWFVSRPSQAGPLTLPATPLDTARRVRDSFKSRTVGLVLEVIILIIFIYQGVAAFLPTYIGTTKQLSQPIVGVLYSVFFLIRS